MAQQPKTNANTRKWDENCLKTGGIPFSGQDYRKYKPSGKFTVISTGSKRGRLDTLPIYVNDPHGHDFKGVIIFIYDIFGWNKESKNIFEFADLLTQETKCRVIMPDFYRNDAWPLDRFPPDADEQDGFSDWWQGVASEKVVVKDIYEKILSLKSCDGHKIGVIGLCWGGLQSIMLATDKDRFKCVAAIHPARIDANLIKSLEVPIFYGPADGDFEATKAAETLKSNKKKLFKDSVFHHFKGMTHGFCASRGDWRNEDIKENVDKCVHDVSAFFKKHLSK